jgi:hypothetical protein
MDDAVATPAALQSGPESDFCEPDGTCRKPPAYLPGMQGSTHAGTLVALNAQLGNPNNREIRNCSAGDVHLLPRGNHG